MYDQEVVSGKLITAPGIALQLITVDEGLNGLRRFVYSLVTVMQKRFFKLQ